MKSFSKCKCCSKFSHNPSPLMRQNCIDLHEEEIFYLRTRGINNKDAKSLLVKAFCQDLLSKIKDVSYSNEANTLIDEWLLSHVN